MGDQLTSFYERAIRQHGLLDSGQIEQLLERWLNSPEKIWGEPLGGVNQPEASLIDSLGWVERQQIFASHTEPGPPASSQKTGFQYTCVSSSTDGVTLVRGVLFKTAGELEQVFHTWAVRVADLPHKFGISTTITDGAEKLQLGMEHTRGDRIKHYFGEWGGRILTRLLARTYGWAAVEEAANPFLVRMYFTQALPRFMVASVGVTQRG